MNKLVLATLFLFSCPLARPQAPPVPATPNPAPQPWTDHFRKATVCLGRVITIGTKRSFSVVGTGVLVTSQSRKVYLVTAKHMFDDPSQAWHPSELRIRFAIQENKTFTQDLGWPIILTDSSGGNLWSALPDGSDIAAIPIPATFSPIVTDEIGFQDFATSNDVFDGGGVFVFGYPMAAQILTRPDGLVRAVTRSGIIAWTDPNGPMDNPLLLDSNVMPGNSGGPAFRVPIGTNKAGGMDVGGRVSFLGIVTQDYKGYYSVEADGRVVSKQWPDLTVPSIEQVGVIGIGGLGKETSRTNGF